MRFHITFHGPFRIATGAAADGLDDTFDPDNPLPASSLKGLMRAHAKNLLSIEPLTVRYMFKRSAKFQERATLSFSEERIHYKTPLIDSTLDWNLFSGLIEDDALFLLLYRAPRSYAIIPKRAFATEEETAEFRRLVYRKVPHANGVVDAMLGSY